MQATFCLWAGSSIGIYHIVALLCPDSFVSGVYFGSIISLFKMLWLWYSTIVFHMVYPSTNVKDKLEFKRLIPHSWKKELTAS